ncbi:MAG TPA: CBS domain-containing protein [Solirubrobacteraceae bacterium]|nr:CBS domain-containing protein [Solirubrobacteraceae bacterium]
MSATTVKNLTGSFVMPTLEHATVSDAMHPGVLSCEPDATATELARLMSAQHVHCIVVMGIAHDAGGESLVWGTITDLDLLRAGLAGGAEQTAQAIARHTTLSVEPTMPLRAAGRLMLEQGVSHLLVVEPRAQRPIGVLSSLDLAGVMAWGEA